MPTPNHQPPFYRDAFLGQVEALDLPIDSFAVIGSGVLAVLGIRPARDIDLVVTQKLFTHLQVFEPGWETKKHSNTDWLYIKKPPYDISTAWHDGTGRILTLPELLPATQVYEGIRFVGLGSVLGWKRAQGRHKDKTDVKLIEAYAERNGLILPRGIS